SGLAESRERAQALILAGKVRVAGETIRKPDRSVSEDAAISVETAPDYASRGALKLGPALDRFGVDPSGRVGADIGAYTARLPGVRRQRSLHRRFHGRAAPARRRACIRDRRRPGAAALAAEVRPAGRGDRT